ncbi:C-type mannose receptor 2-like [Melanotaenia boesemani]|uniref:C-type mannose receptor 2-like n=1 Tax=Melanotaenia boesemani TaxID=1250792 RepID=UPI001C03B33B|nr:C-type mannose receptor 2-like [Melanotaenia boesemani]
MEKVLFIAAASALCAASPAIKGRNYFINEEKTWTEARSYCKEKYTDMVTVSSMEDVEILNGMKGIVNEKPWIGLSNGTLNWTWSMADKDFYTQNEAGFANWAPDVPDYINSEVQCAAMNNAGQWNPASCENPLISVCSKVNGSDVSFFPINTEKSWTDAQSHCRESYTDLASVRNITENEEISNMIPEGQSAWTGLFRYPWKWVDGSIFSFSYWGVNDPGRANDNCVAVDFADSGKWKIFNCSETRTFICYKAPFSKQVVRLRLTRPSVDLNDPTMLDALLTQFKQNLMAQGVGGDIKLSWRKQSDGKTFHKERRQDATSGNDGI